MRKLVVTEFVSLDGVIEGPGGENKELGPWTFAFDRGDDGNKFKVDETMASDALLLGRALTDRGLVDEYRVMLFPVILGQGKKLFQDGRPKTTLKLLSSQPVGPDGVIVLTYVPARD